MRKITKEASRAFANGSTYGAGNTSVHHDTLPGGRVSFMYLHGNLIAEQYTPAHENEPRLRLTLAGWPTPTTRERLNGLCEILGHGRPFYQQAHSQYCALPNAEPYEISAHESVLVIPDRVPS